jgi:glycerol uptake facilitator protein
MELSSVTKLCCNNPAPGCSPDISTSHLSTHEYLQVQLVQPGYDLDPEDHLPHHTAKVDSWTERLVKILPHAQAYFAEFVGTFLLVLFGIGSVTVAVLTGSLPSLFDVASIWAFGVAIAIYATAPISGAHLNPAITFTLWIYQHKTGFSGWMRMLGYQLAQYLGAFLAGGVTYGIWSPIISAFEANNGIVRGDANSIASAMIFHQYFPNFGIMNEKYPLLIISPWTALFVEAFGTGILAFAIFTFTDKCNSAMLKGAEPLMIGFTVAVLISIFAPISQAGFNPCRDFSPRLVAYIAGWGSVAIPGPQDGFWIYLIGPYLGAPVGAGIAFLLNRRRDTCEPHEKCE